MADPLDGLTEAQARAATHRGGALLVHGAAGTGKSTVLAARAAWLVAGSGIDAHRVVLTVATPDAAARTRRRLEARMGGAAVDVVVTTLPDLCLRLLRDEGTAVGLDPFVVPATRTERIAVLLEHRDELALLHHDGWAGGGRGHLPLLASAVARIDRLKEAMVDAGAIASWAAGLPDDDPRAPREREFARLLALHDRVLRERGLVDHGEVVLRLARAIEPDPDPARRAVAARAAARVGHLLVDDVQDLPASGMRLLDAFVAAGTGLTAAGDDDQAVRRVGASGSRNLRDLAAEHLDLSTAVLDRSWRSPDVVMRAAAAAVEPLADRLEHRWHAAGGGTVRFWRATTERAQAQAAAQEVERLVRDGVAADRIVVLVGSPRREGGPVTAALEERAIPHRLGGAGAFLERAEVRDVLAWLRLLVDPSDAPAVSRALSRPPIDLRSADLARAMQIAKRRRVDLVGALGGALESPQTPPEVRDRIASFLRLQRSAQRALDVTRPDQFVHRLVEHLGLRRQQVFSTSGDTADRLRDLGRVGALAERHVRISPQATARDFARWMITLAEAGGDPAGKVEAAPFASGPAGGEDDAEIPEAEDAVLPVVRVLPIAAAAEVDADHVLVLGLQATRARGLDGAAHGLVDQLPEELLGEAAVADPPAAHRDEERRALLVAMTRARHGVVLAFPSRATSGAPREPSPAAEDARRALGAEWEEREEQPFGPDEGLHATFRGLRDDLLRDVASIGARLGDLRMDTDLDVAHGVVRYLELVKVAALLNRAEGQPLADALPAIDAALQQAATAQQKDVLATSGLDEEVLVTAEQTARRTAAGGGEPSLEPFLPLRGDGLVLSAGDLFTYGACPLRYKFARVLRIPQVPTTAQRFGIVVHQVLERWHAQGGTTAEELRMLLAAGWRRSGLSGVPDEERLWTRADEAMGCYAARTAAEPGEAVWLERSFEFRMGPHTVRGRVDRVDRHPDGVYELVDFKTGRPRTAEELRDDVQLALYAVAASDAWGLDAARQSYHYVLDDAKVPLPSEGTDADAIGATVRRTAEAVLDQRFEPTPSYETCATCDYRLTCPAAET